MLRSDLLTLSGVVDGKVFSIDASHVLSKITGEDFYIEGCAFDSRKVQGGNLFLCLPSESGGEHGHTYLKQAFERGANVALVEDISKCVEFLPEEPMVLIEVKDTRQALWSLAAWWRSKFSYPIVGITGSVGKTTVKQLTATILLEETLGYYAQGSYNNHVGLPISILNLNDKYAWGVFELGMNHAGEMLRLSKLLQPDIAAITCIAPSHIGHFNSLDDIAKAKLEILEGVKEGGQLILNGDDDCLLRNFNELTHKLNVSFFGQNPQYDCFISDIQESPLTFNLSLKGQQEQQMELSLLGKHTAMNVACATLIAAKTVAPARVLKLPKVRGSLLNFVQTDSRLQQIYNPMTGQLILNDAYNANPTSMAAFLSVVENLLPNYERSLLIVGDMKELGAFSERYHQEIGQRIAELDFDELIVVGEFAQALAGPMRRRISALESRESNPTGDSDSKKRESRCIISCYVDISQLKIDLSQYDFVALKASNSVKLYTLIE